MAQWQKAEARSREALKEYARAAQSTYQSRLFAEDALEVLRLVDTIDQEFDVVVINPPFGQPTDFACGRLKSENSDGWKDIYAGFFERSIALKRQGGFIGAITSSQFFHTRQMKNLRDNIIMNELPIAIVDLGKDVLDDAAVQTALTVLGDPRSDALMAYADLFDVDDKEVQLLSRVKTQSLQYLPLRDIAVIPGRPLCLHASPNILRQWRIDKTLDPTTASVVTGNHTFDDERFLRIFPELTPDINDWVQFEKGGEYQPFFNPSNIFLRWGQSGAQLRALNVEAYGSDAQVMQSSVYWGKMGLCFNHVSSVGFSPRVLPSKTIFSSESISIFFDLNVNFAEKEMRDRYLVLLGFLSSTVAQELVYVFGRFRKIENRAVSGIPISFSRLSTRQDALRAIAIQGISISRKLSSFDETTPCFLLPELIARTALKFGDRLSLRQEAVDLYKSLDELCDNLTEITDDDVQAVRRSGLVGQFSLLRANHSDQDLADECLSWGAGVAFGRFDWRLATGEREVPPEPDPFDPLPLRSFGMLPDGADPFHAYSGILADDQGHPHDLAQLIEEVLGRVGAPVPGDVRLWLQRDFFPLHLKQYAKSRRKAPIYWPLSTPSGSYTLWLYYPSLNSQTLYSAINDFIELKLKQVSRDTAVLRAKGSARSRDDDKWLETLQTLEARTDRFARHAAENRIRPTVRTTTMASRLTAAPLWPLFRHKPWQTILKDTWAKLEKGRLRLGPSRHVLLAGPGSRKVQDRQVPRHRPRP